MTHEPTMRELREKYCKPKWGRSIIADPETLAAHKEENRRVTKLMEDISTKVDPSILLCQELQEKYCDKRTIYQKKYDHILGNFIIQFIQDYMNKKISRPHAYRPLNAKPIPDDKRKPTDSL